MRSWVEELLRFIYWVPFRIVVQHLPLGLSYRICRIWGFVSCLVAGGRRKKLEKGLKRLFSNLSSHRSSRIVRETFQTIGIQIPYTGDPNANCGATVRYKPQGSGTWKTGHPFSRISDIQGVYNTRLAGCISGQAVLWCTLSRARTAVGCRSARPETATPARVSR